MSTFLRISMKPSLAEDRQPAVAPAPEPSA